MNKELIKQLAKQSQKVVGYTDGGYTELKELDQEKFAELIIRECAGVCVEQRQYQPKEVYAQAVLSHFGVEE